MCPYWVSIGECETNPTFMERNCKKSCKLCPITTTTRTTRSTTPTTTATKTITTRETTTKTTTRKTTTTTSSVICVNSDSCGEMAFCNYNFDTHGFCQSCSNYTEVEACFEEDFIYYGKPNDECAEVCFAEVTTTTRKTSTTRKTTLKTTMTPPFSAVFPSKNF